MINEATIRRDLLLELRRQLNSTYNDGEFKRLNLLRLDLQSNEIVCILEIIQNSPMIEQLLIHSSHLGGFLNKLIEILSKLKSLEVISIKYNSLSDMDSIVISQFITKNRTLKTIYLNSQEISSIALDNIMQALKNHPTVNSFSLTCEKIQETGIKIIANTLNETSLTQLQLIFGEVSFAATILLATAFRANTKLKILDISAMQIEYYRYLLDSIKQNSSLEKVYLEIVSLEDDLKSNINYLIETILKRRNANQKTFVYGSVGNIGPNPALVFGKAGNSYDAKLPSLIKSF